MRLNRCTALALVLSAGVVHTGRASADTWNVARHDPARTGASAGSVALDGPSVRWRAYVGGRPTDASTRFGMGDAAVVVTSTGGRFVAKNVVTQAKIWTSEMLGPGTVADIADLDGDGAREVVVQTADQAHVLDGETGAVLWSSPSDAIQVMGAVRVADLDDDGLPDVYLDNGVGAKSGTELAAAYSFAGAPTKLWSLPITITPQSVNSGTDSLLDVDGNGVPEIFLTSWNSIRVVDGASGATVATLSSPTAGPNSFYQASVLAAELNGSPGEEVVVVQPVAHSLLEISPGLTAFAVDPVSGQSSVLWSVDAGSYDAELAASADTASDLDGDGEAEVIFSYRSSATGDEWVTEVLEGSTGAVLDTVFGARFDGAADLNGDGASELIVATTTGLSVYELDGSALTAMGSPLDGMRTLTLTDPALRSAGQLQGRVATLSQPAGRTVFVGEPSGLPSTQAVANSFVNVRGLVFDGTDFQTVGSYSPLLGVVTGATRADGATRPYEQLALGTSEGVVAVLDGQLTATNGATWLGLDPVGTFVGGGTVAPPLVGADSGGPFIVLAGTAVGTVVADASFASLIIPPLPRWWRSRLTSPSVISLDGVSTVVGVEGSSLVARQSTSGLKVGEVQMQPGWIWGTPIPIHATGSDDALVGVDWRVDGMAIEQTAVSFSTDSVQWTAAPIAVGGFFGSSASDIDGDGTDEWFSLSTTLNRRDVGTGASVSLGDFPQLGYSMPLVAPFKGSTPELLLQSGGQGPTLLESDFSVAWQGAAPEAVNGMAGTRTSCNGASVFVTPAVQSPFLRAYDGVSGALVAERVLAGGETFGNIAQAELAGKKPGLLSHASSVADVAGNGPSVVVGSSDGFVYVVDSCTLEARWSADLGASVGEAVIADFDGDGEDEITVSAADGFVYGLDSNCFEAPVVACGDGGSGAWAVGPGESVSVEWAATEGATGYEIALVSPDDKPLWSPAYRLVDGTSAEIDLAGALAGRPYRVAVRAVGPDGAGAEGFSRALVIKDVSAPAAKLTVNGGTTASIVVDASDDLALDHYVFRVAPDGEEARVIADGALAGLEDVAAADFTPPADLWGLDIEIDVEVVDSGRLTGVASVKAHVTDDGVVVMSASGDDLPLPEGSGEDGGDLPGPRGESGCSAGTGPTSPGWAGLSLLLALAAARRRSQRR